MFKTRNCITCSLFRLIHAKKSFPAETRSEVERELQNLKYPFGFVFADVDKEDDEETKVNIFSLIGVQGNLNRLLNTILQSRICSCLLPHGFPVWKGIRTR